MKIAVRKMVWVGETAVSVAGVGEDGDWRFVLSEAEVLEIGD